MSDYGAMANAHMIGFLYIPMPMIFYSRDHDLIFDVSKTKMDCTIIDIVMDPEETVLIKEAIKYKRNYILGKNMLLAQVKLAGNFFKLW